MGQSTPIRTDQIPRVNLDAAVILPAERLVFTTIIDGYARQVAIYGVPTGYGDYKAMRSEILEVERA